MGLHTVSSGSLSVRRLAVRMRWFAHVHADGSTSGSLPTCRDSVGSASTDIAVDCSGSYVFRSVPADSGFKSDEASLRLRSLSEAASLSGHAQSRLMCHASDGTGATRPGWQTHCCQHRAHSVAGLLPGPLAPVAIGNSPSPGRLRSQKRCDRRGPVLRRWHTRRSASGCPNRCPGRHDGHGHGSACMQPAYAI